jgi:hypothetical protein
MSWDEFAWLKTNDEYRAPAVVKLARAFAFQERKG